MKITYTYDPGEVKIGKDESVILQSAYEWLKDLAKDIRACNNSDQIRQAEHDFFEVMSARYGGQVAGALLLQLWKMTPKEEKK